MSRTSLRLALAALLGLVVAGLVRPAEAQTAPPPLRIASPNPACGPVGLDYEVSVTGSYAGGRQGPMEVRSPSGVQIGEGSWFTDRSGNLSGRVFFSTSVNGYYTIRAFDTQVGQSSNPVYFSSPCRSPRLTFSPTCSTPGTAQTLTVIGSGFVPNGRAAVQYDWNGETAAQTRSRIVIDGAGRFKTDAGSQSSPFSVTPPDRAVPIRATDTGSTIVVNWSSCPPGTTTSTSTSTPESAPGPDGTTTTALDEPGPTTTLRVVDPPGPPVTVPPADALPPVTPGATLTVNPELGPAGFVTGASGTGFPPGPVVLVWEPGLGRTTTVAGVDGTFAARVLILPNDRLGPRALVATGGGATAVDPFLVVPSSVQPSGGDVGQINRTRRFNQR